MGGQKDVDVTIMTPTFNRAHTLRRAHASLLEQSLQNFEWLVVDDGSTDGTGELIDELRADTAFPIRYVRQEHGGKHVARNRAIPLARGRFFVGLDSDDWFLPEALETLSKVWESIPSGQRHRFLGVAGRCALPNGKKIGGDLPTDVLDSNEIELRNRMRVHGDNAGMSRIDVLSAFPTPEIEAELFVTEAVVQNRIAREYQTRYFNDVIMIRDYQPGGLSDRSRITRMQSPSAARLYYRELLSSRKLLGQRSQLRASINCIRYTLHSGAPVWPVPGQASKTAWIGGLPIALVLWAGDRRLHRKARQP
jgi:glycosyltransferase involved in cell wall biosynthesis